MPSVPKPSNPYYNYNVVRDLNMLFGRKEELQEIYDMIEKKQSVSLLGLPRIGKSSILHNLGKLELQERLGYNFSQYIFVLVSLSDYQDKTRDDFFRATCEQITAQCQKMKSLSFSTQKAQDSFPKLLQELHENNLHLILLTDGILSFSRSHAASFLRRSIDAILQH